MRYRKLGNTGIQVSEIAFGTIPILSGDVPVLPEYFSPSVEEALRVMEHAFHLGCNLYDTAIVPEYGDAEIKLGKFASYIGRENIVISDKARFFDGEEMYQAILTSCDNLGTFPDIYFVHQVDEQTEERTFGKYGAVDAMTQLKKEGKIRFVGIASHYYDILLRGAKDPRVDVLQGSGNILERGMLERIKEEQAFHGKGILINKVYAAGILPTYFPVETLIQGVLTYPVSSVLLGLGTIEQVNQGMGKEINDAQCPSFSQVLATLEKSFPPIPCDRCQKCKCVYGTEIHRIFRQYNYYFLGKEYWALRKLDLSIRESVDYCKSCTLLTCIKQCPRKIHIPKTIEMIGEMVEQYIHNGNIL